MQLLYFLSRQCVDANPQFEMFPRIEWIYPASLLRSGASCFASSLPRRFLPKGFVSGTASSYSILSPDHSWGSDIKKVGKNSSGTLSKSLFSYLRKTIDMQLFVLLIITEISVYSAATYGFIYLSRG